MTRGEWLAALSVRAAEAERIGALAPLATVLRDLAREAETVDGWPAAKPIPDTLIPLEEAAQRLRVTPRWLRDQHPDYVVTLGDKTLRVSEKRLAAFLEAPGRHV